MKMEMKQQQKQKLSQKNILILIGTTSIIGILIVVLMVTGMFKWEVSTGGPSQNQTENLSTFKTGSWSNHAVWNKGLNKHSTSSIFNPTIQELDFNLDQVNFTHSTSTNPRPKRFSSLKKCGSTNSNPCKGLGQKNNLEFGESVIKTNDGNYAVIGKTNSFNNNGQLYVAKFKQKHNGKFNVLWATQVGNGQQTAAGKAILQNSNDEYIAVGKTKKNNYGVQAYIVNLNKQGQVQWQRTVGGDDEDVANDIIQTQNGNYLMTGTSKKWGGNSKGIYCLNFKLKTNGNGIVKNWDHIYGAPGKLDKGVAADQMSGGDFAITGYTEYDQNPNQSNGQIFATRIENNGQMKWSRTIGNPESNKPSDILVDQNDDIVITGHSKASINGNDKMSTYTLKLDNSGNLQWDRAIRKYDNESYAESITLTNSNNNYVISGYSATPNNNKDAYLAKIGTNGNLKWDQLGGSSSNDKAFGITSLPNGKFLTVGKTHSVNNSNGDMLVSMVDNNGNLCTGCKGSKKQVVTKQNLNNLQLHNNRNFRFESKVVSTANQQVNGSSNTSSDCDPCTGLDGGGDEWLNDVIETTNGYIYVGRTSSFGSGSKNAYVVKLDKNYNVQWQQMIGSPNGLEEASAIAETSVSNEYIIAGRSKVNSFGNNDIYLIKIKDGGNNASVQWERLIGGPSDESASDLVKLKNDNYVLAGRTTSFVNNSDGVLIRFSLNNFSIEWRKLFGDPNTDDNPKAITSSSPNSVSVVSYTDATNNGGIYLTQFSANGNFEWGRLLGGSNTDKPFGITADHQNNLILTGFSQVSSSNGGTGTKDLYAAKFDNNGNKKWDQLVNNNNGVDKGMDVHTTQSGEYVITGTYEGQNSKEVSFVNLGSDGSIHFSSAFGGQSKDLGHAILQNDNGNFVIAGKTESSKFVNNNNGALVYRVMANGVPTKASGNGSSGPGQGPSNGSYNNSNNEVPDKDDVAHVTQDVVVRNQNQKVRHLNVKKDAIVKIDSNRSLEIKDTLNLTGGYLSVEHGGELVLDHDATVINMDSTNLTGKLSFINKNNFVDSVVFRLDSAKDLKRASVHDFNQGNSFRSYHIEKDPNNEVGNQKGNNLNVISESEYYNIKRDSGNGSCKVTLFWNQNNSTHFKNIANKDDLIVAHWDGSKWVNENNSNVKGDLDGSGYVTSQTVSNFSEWTFGSTGSNPLPVEMTYFRGEKTEQGTQLNWATASETNNSHFEVLRKLPNSDFKQIGEVEGHGQSTQAHQYQFNDPSVEANGTVYYKLKQVDFDGSFEHSKVIAINLKQSIKEDLTIQNVYPNPFQGRFNVSFRSSNAKPVKVQLLNMNGQVILNRTIKANAGPNTFTYNEGDQLNPGNYTIILKTDGNQAHQKIVKR